MSKDVNLFLLNSTTIDTYLLAHSKFEILTTKVYEILKYIYLHKATRDKESLQPATHSIMRKNEVLSPPINSICGQAIIPFVALYIIHQVISL